MAPVLTNPFIKFPPSFDDTGLLAYYKFNEASGDIINQSQSSDSLGSAVDIQITGATYRQTGKLDYSLYFDGVNDFGVAGTEKAGWIPLHYSKFSVVFWFKKDATPVSTEGIFTNSEQGDGVGTWCSTSSSLGFNCQTFRAQNDDVISHGAGDNYIPDLTDFHMYSWVGDNGRATLTDSIKRDNANESTSNRLDTPVNSNPYQYMEFMRRQSTTPQRYCSGYLCEMSFWNRELSNDELASLYNSGSGAAIY